MNYRTDCYHQILTSRHDAWAGCLFFKFVAFLSGFLLDVCLESNEKSE